MNDFYGSATAAITIFIICFYNYFSAKRDRKELDERARLLIDKQAEIAAHVSAAMEEHIAGLRQISEDSLRQLRSDLAKASLDRYEQTEQLRQQVVDTQNAVQTDVAENTNVTKAAFEQVVVAKETVAAIAERI